MRSLPTHRNDSCEAVGGKAPPRKSRVAARAKVLPFSQTRRGRTGKIPGVNARQISGVGAGGAGQRQSMPLVRRVATTSSANNAIFETLPANITIAAEGVNIFVQTRLGQKRKTGTDRRTRLPIRPVPVSILFDKTYRICRSFRLPATFSPAFAILRSTLT